MSGSAMFSGATFQARAAAFVYVHVLAQRPLGWLGVLVNDTPSFVTAETSGPGDDLGITYAANERPSELQAKHGLTAAKLKETLLGIHSRSKPGDASRVILPVNRVGAQRLHKEFAPDCDRLRAGRADALHASTRALLADLNLGDGGERLLRRIHVVPFDIDNPADLEAKQAVDLLATRLKDPGQATIGWNTLVSDATDIAARRLGRDRADLIRLLEAAGIGVRPPQRDEPWIAELDFIKDLLDRQADAVALGSLSRLEVAIVQSGAETSPDSEVQSRLARYQAIALLRLERTNEAMAKARRALDFSPSNVPALTVASATALLAGQLPEARSFAERAVKSDPQSAHAWVAMVRAQMALGESPQTVPDAVTRTTHYRTQLAHLAAERGSAAELLERTAELLADGVRTEDVLLLRANAILAPTVAGGDHAASRFADVDRLMSEVLDRIDEFHPQVVRALVLRGNARERMGRAADANEDLARARRLRADDPDAILHTARMRLMSGDPEGALQVLRQPVVDRTLDLLCLRAHAHDARDDSESALRDLDAAEALLPEENDPDLSRIRIADAAAELGDVVRGERMLAAVSSSMRQDSKFVVVTGRLAFARKNIEEGRQRFSQAMALDPSQRTAISVELAERLLRANNADAAVEVLDALAEVPSYGLKTYAKALVAADKLSRVQELVDGLAKGDEMPTWAIAMTIDIAMRREDDDTAIEQLFRLLERAPEGVRERIALTRLLIEAGRIADATAQLDKLLCQPIERPTQRMQVAQLLHFAGRVDEALPIAFRAFRDAPHDPRMHRALLTIALTGHPKVRSVDEVGPDTWVRLMDRDGIAREHFVYASPPIDPSRNEMALSEAEAAGLLGERVGDIVVRNAGAWNEQRWTVQQVLPAEVRVVQIAGTEYEHRFPNEPFFLTSIHIGDGSAIDAFTPIIASLEEQRKRVERVLAAYREQGLPLGAVVHLFGRGTIADAMGLITERTEAGATLLVEFSDAGRSAAEAAARVGGAVLTLSALTTISDLDLLEALKERAGLITPRSLVVELKQSVREAEDWLANGHKMMRTVNGLLHADDIPAGDLRLVAALDKRRRLLDWVMAHTTIEPLPLDYVPKEASEQEEARELIGASSYDAVILSSFRNTPLYADDLGLRRFTPAGIQRPSSFSTLTLLPALAIARIISEERRDAALVSLAVRRYGVLAPTVAMLAASFRQNLSQVELDRAFAALVSPQIAPIDAARVVARLIRREVTATVQVASVEVIGTQALRVMTTRWPVNLATQLLIVAATDEMPLLPNVVREVNEACAKFRDAAGGH